MNRYLVKISATACWPDMRGPKAGTLKAHAIQKTMLAEAKKLDPAAGSGLTFEYEWDKVRRVEWTITVQYVTLAQDQTNAKANAERIAQLCAPAAASGTFCHGIKVLGVESDGPPLRQSFQVGVFQ